MGLNIVLLVLASAAIHPLWNLLLKKSADPRLSYLLLTATMCLCALVHGIYEHVDFTSVLDVLPLVALSVGGLLLYGTCLTATLRRGDLSAYYPIVRASPVFVVGFSLLFLGKTYPPAVIVGIAMVLAGGFLLLYRRGTRFLDDPRTLGLALLTMSGTGIYSLADARMMDTIMPQAQVFVVNGVSFPVYCLLWLRQRSDVRFFLTRIRTLSLGHSLLPGMMAYASYYLILLAYQQGADVAAVTTMRQASIPISVILGGLFLREVDVMRRFLAAGLLAAGIVVVALNG